MRTTWNGLPAVRLSGPDGASACIADHGAHLLSWTPARGGDGLFMSSRTRFGANDAIRGGVPVIFPQFGERGSGKRHGFARTAAWRLDGVDSDGRTTEARYVLNDDAIGGSAVPGFALEYRIAIEENTLRLALSVHNRSAGPWQFNAALHTYLAVGDLAAARIGGLQGLDYIDQVDGGARKTERQAPLHIDGEVDRIYLAVPGSGITLQDGKRNLVVRQHGFADAVVWNPGADKAAQLSDLGADEYRRFVCIEAAAVDAPIRLEPSASWTGAQIIIAR